MSRTWILAMMIAGPTELSGDGRTVFYYSNITGTVHLGYKSPKPSDLEDFRDFEILDLVDEPILGLGHDDHRSHEVRRWWENSFLLLKYYRNGALGIQVSNLQISKILATSRFWT